MIPKISGWDRCTAVRLNVFSFGEADEVVLSPGVIAKNYFLQVLPATSYRQLEPKDHYGCNTEM